LWSRAIIVEFKPLSFRDVFDGLERGVEFYKEEAGKNSIVLEKGCLESMASMADGDMRKALNNLELVLVSKDRTGVEDVSITVADVERVLQRKVMNFDSDGDVHYDLLSAFQKSIRGSDPDAALAYLAMLIKGEDLISIIRRLLVISAEDIGLAYPQAISIVKA